MSQVKTVKLLNEQTTTTISAVVEPWGTRRTVKADVAGTGAVSATVIVQVSNDESGTFLDLGTLLLSGTTTASAGLAMDAAWRYMRVNMSAVSGTGAKVTVTLGTHNG